MNYSQYNQSNIGRDELYVPTPNETPVRSERELGYPTSPIQGYNPDDHLAVVQNNNQTILDISSEGRKNSLEGESFKEKRYIYVAYLLSLIPFIGAAVTMLYSGKYKRGSILSICFVIGFLMIVSGGEITSAQSVVFFLIVVYSTVELIVAWFCIPSFCRKYNERGNDHV